MCSSDLYFSFPSLLVFWAFGLDDESGPSLRGGTSVGISISAVPVVSVGASDVEEEGIGDVVRAVAAALTRALR